MLSLHRSLKTRQVREMDIIITNHQETDQELFAKAVKEIVYHPPAASGSMRLGSVDLTESRQKKYGKGPKNTVKSMIRQAAICGQLLINLFIIM